MLTTPQYSIHAEKASLCTFRKPVLQGWQDANGFWRLPHDEESKPSGQEVETNVYSLPSMPQTIRYLHAAAGFPTKDSWINAIKNGHYSTWPGITVESVNRHFPELVETQKGHMKKQLQTVRSTKQKLIVDEVSEESELTRSITKQNILVKVINASEMVYTDQTGWFPVQSNKGITLLMVYYDIDANYIDAEPIRNHTDSQMIAAYQKLWARTNQGGKD